MIGLAFAALGLFGKSIEPVTSPKPWEILSEICVVVGLFGVGLQVDKLWSGAQWRPTIGLLVLPPH